MLEPQVLASLPVSRGHPAVETLLLGAVEAEVCSPQRHIVVAGCASPRPISRLCSAAGVCCPLEIFDQRCWSPLSRGNSCRSTNVNKDEDEDEDDDEDDDEHDDEDEDKNEDEDENENEDENADVRLLATSTGLSLLL